MIAVGVGILFAIAGVIVAALAALRTKRRLDAVKARAATLLDVERMQLGMNRLQHAAEEAGPLVDRAKVAIDRINAGLRELKLPQAVFALQTAGAAIRLLLKGRA